MTRQNETSSLSLLIVFEWLKITSFESAMLKNACKHCKPFRHDVVLSVFSTFPEQEHTEELSLPPLCLEHLVEHLAVV